MFETDWLKKWNLYSPHAIALKDADSETEISYSKFFEFSNRLARGLKNQFGIREGDRIACLAFNELEYIILFFAAQRLGAILVPINFRLTAREMTHIISDCSPKLLVFQKSFETIIKDIPPNHLPQYQIYFEENMPYQSPHSSLMSMIYNTQNSSEYLPMQGNEDTKCMILYTSGTTGAPKGAMITLGMLFWNSINTSLRLNIIQSDVTLSFLPLFHTGGWNVLTTPFIHRGAKVILLKKFEAERILKLCETEKVSILFGVPTMLDMMYQTPIFDEVSLKSVRYAIVGGEPMPIKLIQIWQEKGIPIRQGYGLTEFGPNVFSLNQEDSERKIGSIGFPNFYIEAKIIGEHGEELGDNQVGELVLKGPSSSAGYWNHPEATAQTIKNGWLHTGDLVRRDSEGYYYVVGRKKRYVY